MRTSFIRLSRVSCASRRPQPPAQLSHHLVSPDTALLHRTHDALGRNAHAVARLEHDDDSTTPADEANPHRDCPPPTRPPNARDKPRPELPRCTADSSVASTSKLPCLPPPSSVPTASSILLSSLASSVPTCEPALYRLLRRISSVHPSIRAEWFYQLHSHPLVHSTCTSTRTYAFLLDEAFRDSDERLVDAILDEMKRRAIPWDRNLGRILLKGYRKLGTRDGDDRSTEVLNRLERDEGAGDQEWVIEGRITKRLNLGSKGKGKAREGIDLLGGEGVPWRGWTVRTRDVERARKGQVESSRASLAPTATCPRTTKTRKRPRANATLPTPPTTTVRQRVLIPPNSNALSSSSVSQLVQLLVQDERTDDAFSLADSWLSANRPALASDSSSPCPALTLRTHRYNSTLVVLLNILLKPLLLARSPLSSILSFPSDFVARHRPPLALPQPLPGLSTLREILSGVSGRKNGWRNGKRIVDHFGYQWGLAVGDRGFEELDSRLRFKVPTCPRWKKYLFLDNDDQKKKQEETRVEVDVDVNELDDFDKTNTDTNKDNVAPTKVVGARPYWFVPASVAALLLRLAVDAQTSRSTRLDPLDLVRFRRWWSFVTSREEGSDYLRGSTMRALLTKARDVGLLERSHAAKKRTAYYMLKDRKAGQNRRKRDKAGGAE